MGLRPNQTESVGLCQNLGSYPKGIGSYWRVSNWEQYSLFESCSLSPRYLGIPGGGGVGVHAEWSLGACLPFRQLSHIHWNGETEAPRGM